MVGGDHPLVPLGSLLPPGAEYAGIVHQRRHSGMALHDALCDIAGCGEQGQVGYHQLHTGIGKGGPNPGQQCLAAGLVAAAISSTLR